jgi:hypothetical protein
MAQFSLEEFRQVATVSEGARFGLFNGCVIPGLIVSWESSCGKHKLDVNLNTPDPVKSVYEEIKKIPALAKNLLEKP